MVKKTKGRGRPKKEKEPMDAVNATNYIRRKFDAQPYFWPCEDNQMQNEAKESFQSMKDMQVIWAWIEKHLDDEQ
ncbi:MAG: hypothetical protein Q9M28_00725, partial [Mariprofundaceae bacterium]|nr:hypothetical protein [Mariprofundaceae bacterium]